MNLAANLTRNAAAHPDRVAIRLGDDVVTYRDLDESSARVAGLLAGRGVRPGQPIAIMLPNVPEYAVVYYGVLRAGGVVVPMNPLLKAREVAYYLGDSGAPVILAWHTTADEVTAGAAPTGAEAVIVEPAAFGDSARGHGARARGRRPRRRRHGRPAVHVGNDRTAQGRRTDPRQPGHQRRGHSQRPGRDRPRRRDLRRSAAVPLVRADLHAQRRDQRRRLAVAAAALRPEAGIGAACATSGNRVRRRPDDVQRAAGRTGPGRTTTCRRCGCASRAARRMPVEVLRQFEKAFGCTVLEGYGLSETSPVASFNHPAPGAQARLDRHADPRRGDARRGRRPAPRSRPARSARSRSAATTS